MIPPSMSACISLCISIDSPAVLDRPLMDKTMIAIASRIIAAAAIFVMFTFFFTSELSVTHSGTNLNFLNVFTVPCSSAWSIFSFVMYKPRSEWLRPM